MSKLVGYARVSIQDQDMQLQVSTLEKVIVSNEGNNT
jgi:DNA invertase Pin-like site-specific DNA recombinase